MAVETLDDIIRLRRQNLQTHDQKVPRPAYLASFTKDREWDAQEKIKVEGLRALLAPTNAPEKAPDPNPSPRSDQSDVGEVKSRQLGRGAANEGRG